jgi:DNA-binding GntR family transcriptional regulator
MRNGRNLDGAVGGPQAAPRQSHWEAVYQETRRRILTLDLPPGTPLSEIAVAREFGVSATPARDALGRLRQEGLVVGGPGRAYAVAGLSISDVSQLAELRYVLESGIAQLAIRRANPELIGRLREVAGELEAPDLTSLDVINRNQDFHLAVADLTGNIRLVDALRRVLEDSRRIFHLGISALPVPEIIATHKRLVDAIEAGDNETAVRVCDQEAFGTGERVIEALIRGPSASGRHVGIAVATR